MRDFSFLRVSRAVAGALGCTLLVGCGGHFEVPVPVLAAPVVPPASAEPAIITLPIAISLAKIRAQLDTVFPPVDSLDRAKCTALGGLVCHEYIYHRDTLDLRASGDRVTLQTHIRYGASVGMPGVGGIASCGFPPDRLKRADVRLATTLYWRSDWKSRMHWVRRMASESSTEMSNPATCSCSATR